MIQWDYLVEKMYSNQKEHERFDEIDYLKKMGESGWELVSTPTYTIPKYYFKRRKETTTDKPNEQY